MKCNRDVRDMVEKELAMYPVTYEFGNGGKHPFVRITAPGGKIIKVSMPSTTVNYHAKLNQRTHLRSALRDVGVLPYPEYRREMRVGSMGEAIVAAASKATPAPIIDVEYADREADDTIKIAKFNDLPLCPDAIRDRAHQTSSHPDKGHPKMLSKPEVESQPSDDAQKFSKLSQSDVTTAARLVLKHASVDDVDRTIHWNSGWGDDRIRDVLASAPGREGLSVASVQRWRRKEFGLTPEEKQADAMKGGAQNVVDGATNRKRIEHIEDRLANIDRRLAMLEDAMTQPGGVMT